MQAPDAMDNSDKNLALVDGESCDHLSGNGADVHSSEQPNAKPQDTTDEKSKRDGRCQEACDVTTTTGRTSFCFLPRTINHSYSFRYMTSEKCKEPSLKLRLILSFEIKIIAR